jgi:hypothetical protein
MINGQIAQDVRSVDSAQIPVLFRWVRRCLRQARLSEDRAPYLRSRSRENIRYSTTAWWSLLSIPIEICSTMSAGTSPGVVQGTIDASPTAGLLVHGTIVMLMVPVAIPFTPVRAGRHTQQRNRRLQSNS